MKYIRTKDEIGILVETNKDIRDKDNYWLKKGCYFKIWFSPNINMELKYIKAIGFQSLNYETNKGEQR